MRQNPIILCLLALTLTACKPDPEPEPTPNNGGQNNDTTETVVKKYLVKELLNDDPEKIRLAIDWNEDCTQILHVKYGLGYGSIVDYDFKYYGNDSIRVIPSLPSFSYPLWLLWYDSVMIHLDNNLIDSINCYSNGNNLHTEYYYYDDNHRLINREYLLGSTDFFQWEGDNVVKATMFERDYEYSQFTEYIHPHFNLPFYLSNFVSLEITAPLFTPLWKYLPVYPNCKEYEYDDDSYITKMTFYNYDSTQVYTYNFYYITPDLNN